MLVVVIILWVFVLGIVDVTSPPQPVKRVEDEWNVSATGKHTRNSAIFNELPNPSPSLSVPEYIPTTNTGELEYRPVSFNNLQRPRILSRVLKKLSDFDFRLNNTCTHLDFGLSRPNFATVSDSAFLGSRNLIIFRKSTSLLRKNDWANFRAEKREIFWYIKATKALGMEAKASVCNTAGFVAVIG
jgi:hypothetical protein